MTNPQLDAPDALKAMLTAPNMRELLLPTRAAAAKIYTVDEAMTLATNMAHALNRSPRLPITTTTTKEADGTLTIRITPQTS
ncbi:hypothetical protein [Mycobacterium malmoense]|uniref:hypothetical protein n=1 Tax=Mycobacterium malmoense TaxID=1780 RepID=UPI0008F813F7|nr:hypothetical protein [Mycobacterium malmoense]OIN81650.1 hypothetical protein BMG05_06520 [Mycobacterium malmoense]